MPRHARKYLETSFFHVMVQGINKEYIFRKEQYKNMYVNLLKKYIKNIDLKIISFCIMSNHVHLLAKVEDIKKLSSFMLKVNSAYAKYYNYIEGERVGYVFRDRYKSEPILDRRQLIRCIKYIHENPVKAGIVKYPKDYNFSSYKYFEKHKLKHSIFSKEEMEYICNSKIKENYDFIGNEIDINSKINMGIEEFIMKEQIKTFEIFENRDILKKLIKFLKTERKIKYVDIRNKLEISRGVMDGLK